MQISAEDQVRIGRELRQERERRAITLEEVARATRFSVRHLQSLEADLFDELPGGVLRKGIVRSYCQYIGLDEEEWLDRFSTTGALDHTEPDLALFAENVHRARVDATPAVNHRWWGVLVLAAALCALAYGVWHYVVQPRLGLGQHQVVPQQTLLWQSNSAPGGWSAG